MKKIILTLVVAFSAIVMNAQSFELHQSYNDENAAWGSTRLISEYFYTNDSESVNVFSWNSFSQNGISGLLYAEYCVGANIFLHGEVRAQFGNFEYKAITPEIGLAYLLPIPCEGLGIYLTPKYVYNDVYFSKHDFQFSINSAYENDYIYYEGYFDSNWVNGISFFTEQKAYYKITPAFQLGLAFVADGFRTKVLDFMGADIISTRAHIQPYLTLRVALY